MEISEPTKWDLQIELIISKILCWILDYGIHTIRSERFFRSWNPRQVVNVCNNEPDNDGCPAPTHDHSVYHTRTHFCENWVVFQWEARNRCQTWDRYILHVFISICLFHMFEVLCINVFWLWPYIRSDKNTAVIEKCLSLIQLFSLSKKDILSYITKKTNFALKRVWGCGGVLLGLKNSGFDWKGGVFFVQNPRKGGIFQTWVRAFGRERDAGDCVSEGEFLLLTQITNHMPGKVWD